MAALDQPHAAIVACVRHAAQHVGHPRPRGIDQRAGRDRTPAAGVLDRRAPAAIGPLGIDQPGVRHDRRAAIRGVARVEHDQPAVLHPAIRIDEGAPVVLQPGTARIAAQPDRLGRGQLLAPAEVVVEEQPGAHHPRRSRRVRLRQHEAQRPDDVRRHRPQPLALDQRLTHQPYLAIFQIAQAAVDQLGRGGRGMAGQIVLLDQRHRQAAPGRIARNPGAVDPAADDQQVHVLRVPFHAVSSCRRPLVRHMEPNKRTFKRKC